MLSLVTTQTEKTADSKLPGILLFAHAGDPGNQPSSTARTADELRTPGHPQSDPSHVQPGGAHVQRDPSHSMARGWAWMGREHRKKIARNTTVRIEKASGMARNDAILSEESHATIAHRACIERASSGRPTRKLRLEHTDLLPLEHVDLSENLDQSLDALHDGSQMLRLSALQLPVSNSRQGSQNNEPTSSRPEPSRVVGLF